MRAAIRKAATIYGEPLARIPADLAAFEERWGRGRVAAIPAGFRTHAAFVRWRKNVAGPLARAAGPKAAPAALLPGWAALVALCRKHGGVKRPLPPHLALSLGPVGLGARRGGARGCCAARPGAGRSGRKAVPLGDLPRARLP